jgi:hypothetical protein
VRERERERERERAADLKWLDAGGVGVGTSDEARRGDVGEAAGDDGAKAL